MVRCRGSENRLGKVSIKVMTEVTGVRRGEGVKGDKGDRI